MLSEEEAKDFSEEEVPTNRGSHAAFQFKERLEFQKTNSGVAVEHYYFDLCFKL